MSDDRTWSERSEIETLEGPLKRTASLTKALAFDIKSLPVKSSRYTFSMIITLGILLLVCMAYKEQCLIYNAIVMKFARIYYIVQARY